MQPDEYETARDVQIDAFADPHIGELLDALRDSWSLVQDLNFVAVLDGSIVGHVQYSRAIVDAPAALIDVLVLSPVGVRTVLQNQGVGSTLLRESLQQLRGREEPLVFLEGDPSFYGRFGFEPAGELGFVKPSPRIPDAAFQVVTLEGYDPATMSGPLVYPDAFWRTDSVGLRQVTPVARAAAPGPARPGCSA